MFTRYMSRLNFGALKLACAASALGALVACEGGRSEFGDVRIEGGDPRRGAQLIEEIGCGACHKIPGIGGARGIVGPPLGGWSDRTFIAGQMPNKPGNLIRWLMDPPGVEPSTAMPDLDLNASQARDIAAYLYTLD